jgi:hypothetical protein
MPRPVKRESWTARTEVFTEEQTRQVYDLTSAIYREYGLYRKKYRA